MMKYVTPRKLALYGGIVVSFLMLESPIIMLANRIDPVILGLPFFFVWNLFWWFALTLLFLVAYLTDWGSDAPSTQPTSIPRP